MTCSSSWRESGPHLRPPRSLPLVRRLPTAKRHRRTAQPRALHGRSPAPEHLSNIALPFASAPSAWAGEALLAGQKSMLAAVREDEDSLPLRPEEATRAEALGCPVEH